MGRPLNLVIMLAILAGGFAFVGTLLTAPGQFSVGAYGNEVRVAAIEGNWTRVGRVSRRAIRRAPGLQDALLFWGWSEDKLEHPRGAEMVWTRLRDSARRSIAEGNRNSDQWYYLGWGLHGLGDEPGAQRAWDELIARMRGVGRYNATCYLTLAGEHERALEIWERLAESGEQVDTRWAEVDPDLEAIRAQPRFVAGLESIRARQRAAAESRTRI